MGPDEHIDAPIGHSASDPSSSAPIPPRAADYVARASHVPSNRRGSSGSALSRLLCVFAVLMGLFGLRYLVPYFVEQIQYAATRGRQRAEVEIAAEGLQKLLLADLSTAYQLVSKRVGPSVVHINTVQTATVNEPRDEFGHLFGSPGQFRARGQGSGVIVSDAGFVVTNYHVIRGATEIKVALSDGRSMRGRPEQMVVGVDPLTDIAVLKINADGLIAAKWGSSDQLEVGALVWAIGSPFGLDRTITAGILSAKNRPGLAGPLQQFLQTDAAVNPGNSGGPLVDAHGHVVGINTAIVGQSYQGISFSIPSSIARDVYERLKENGRVERGWLGVALDEVTEQKAQQLELSEPTGALVAAVVRDSPALAAGIRPGDVVVGWGGKQIDNPTTLSRLVAQTEIGSQTKVVVMREGRKQILEVTVGQRPVDLN